MSDGKPLALPPGLARALGQYMDPADIAAATLVTTSPQPATTKMVVYVSYVPRLRSFSAHPAPHLGEGGYL